MSLNPFRFLASLFRSVRPGSGSAQEREEDENELEEPDPSPEQLARKARSEAQLEAEGVPFIAHLPVVESEAEAKIRSKEEVARRAMALLLVAASGEGLGQDLRAGGAVRRPQDVLGHVIERYGLRDAFTPEEKALLKGKRRSPQDVIGATWRNESAWVLLWALGYVEELGRPDHTCDVARAVRTMQERTAAEFVAGARLRPAREILDQADLIYRYHWATTDARINGREPPAGLDPSVVYERHYALNWLIGYMDQEWDEVTTDT
jgi:hypothetical protein